MSFPRAFFSATDLPESHTTHLTYEVERHLLQYTRAWRLFCAPSSSLASHAQRPFAPLATFVTQRDFCTWYMPPGSAKPGTLVRPGWHRYYCTFFKAWRKASHLLHPLIESSEVLCCYAFLRFCPIFDLPPRPRCSRQCYYRAAVHHDPDFSPSRGVQAVHAIRCGGLLSALKDSVLDMRRSAFRLGSFYAPGTSELISTFV